MNKVKKFLIQHIETELYIGTGIVIISYSFIMFGLGRLDTKD